MKRQVGESILIEHTLHEVILNSKSEWGQGSRIPRITVRREEQDQTHPQDPGDTVRQGDKAYKRPSPSLPNNESQNSEFSSESNRKRPRYQMTDFFVSSSQSMSFPTGTPTPSAGPKTKERYSQEIGRTTSRDMTTHALFSTRKHKDMNWS